MPRTKTGTVRHRRHKKVLARTKSFRGANTRLYKRAKEADLHAGQYAYIGRKLRKRDMRSLWILRISAALKQVGGVSYSRFVPMLKKANIALDRKILADIAATDFASFKTIVEKVRG
ncbi:50S ribosomal protein L20 [Patescibacteria group bacterium]|nr:50S ribosomal protein L20 [Patescibacteria group bacterium]